MKDLLDKKKYSKTEKLAILLSLPSLEESDEFYEGLALEDKWIDLFYSWISDNKGSILERMKNDPDYVEDNRLDLIIRKPYPRTICGYENELLLAWAEWFYEVPDAFETIGYQMVDLLYYSEVDHDKYLELYGISANITNLREWLREFWPKDIN